MRLFVTLIAIICFSNSICWGQRYRKPKKEKVTVEQLISSYRFREAAEMLEENITKNEKRRRPTEELKSQLERVRSLEVMLSATEKVKFIDSVVVQKNEFLSIYHLGSDCGTVGTSRSLLPENLAKSPKIGEVAYCNGLNDKIYYADNFGGKESGLHVTARIGESWGQPKSLKGVSGENKIQDFPYVLSDGVTLYYAEKSERGLGGYDIYVTRYSPDTDSYLEPENLGMPFNSMANDYMFAIDEINNLGWFVTDRHQPKDSVCIYIFQPNVTRELYNPVVMGEDMMRRLAQISSINDARLDQISLGKARSRLQQVVAEPASKNYGEKVRYIINDDLVYTSLSEFRHEEVKNIAQQWKYKSNLLNTKEKELDVLRMNFQKNSAADSDREEILTLEGQVESLRVEVDVLAKQMRKAELQK